MSSGSSGFHAAVPGPLCDRCATDAWSGVGEPSQISPDSSSVGVVSDAATAFAMRVSSPIWCIGTLARSTLVHEVAPGFRTATKEYGQPGMNGDADCARP
ncbi:hypothetical protein LK07_03130 [Streptomyces pluripotens]|uniref:Uncharacterized protein n=1 Tax=Streptomyces pluripotens TaxID=1355015 RepID=A0A221NTR9_9ACTN|nr:MULTISPECIES: hypothetical protein [Streptomyces]ARP68932.1 hypothetical protein LK06_002050 [Streptomyces pluripotens]ASN23188.1 hypothetical protein LK07_03130 [Streptomyces pluripotens]KIE25808.1 hypothetical protein LK08_17165 [Streptomyces sp. MUSC 125]MCH0556923.1 hypothetical protein [Streptomyces sp. MUM 16J]